MGAQSGQSLLYPRPLSAHSHSPDRTMDCLCREKGNGLDAPLPYPAYFILQARHMKPKHRELGTKRWSLCFTEGQWRAKLAPRTHTPAPKPRVEQGCPKWLQDSLLGPSQSFFLLWGEGEGEQPHAKHGALAECLLLEEGDGAC